MVKNKIVLEVRKDERLYELVCDNNSPLGELYDSLSQMLNFVIEKIKETEAAVTQKKAEDDKKE